MADLERLNETFWTAAEEDRNRKHYQKDGLLSELFEEDRKALLQLPEKSFECVRYEECRPDKYGLVKIDGRQYSTSLDLPKVVFWQRYHMARSRS